MVSAHGLRILFFLPSLDGGGAERVTLQLCRELQQFGCEVVLVTAHGDASDSPLRDEVGVELVELRARRTLGALPALARLLCHRQVDVVVGVLAHAALVASLALVGTGRKALLVAMQHNTMSVNVKQSPRARDRLVPVLARVAFTRARLIIGVSQGVADDMAATTGIARSRITVLPNPIDYERILALSGQDVPPSLAPAPGQLLVVAAGRLVEQKDFVTLIKALAPVDTDWRLVILGEGPLRPALESTARELGISERVLLPGFMPNPYPLFRTADLFVLSSRWEGLPTVLLELLAFDTPIVATDCRSGPREILTGVAGSALVPVQDVEALTTQISALLGGGRSARPDARQKYDSRAVSTAFLEMIGRARGRQ